MDNTPYVKLGVSCIIVKGENILAGQRKGEHGGGTWAPPGGKVEFGERPEETVIREAIEETGLKIKNPVFATFTNDIFKDTGKHYITLHYVCRYISGEPKVMEPDKFVQLQWMKWKDIPKPLFLTIENLNKQGFDPLRYLPKE